MVDRSGGFSMIRVTVTMLEKANPPILVLTRVAVSVDPAYSTKHSIEFKTTVLEVYIPVYIYTPFSFPIFTTLHTQHNVTHTSAKFNVVRTFAAK